MGSPRLWNLADEEIFRIKERRSQINENQYIASCKNLELARETNRKTKNSRERYWDKFRYLVIYDDSDGKILLVKELKRRKSK